MENNLDDYKFLQKYEVSYYFISVRYTIEIIYLKGITCSQMHDLRIYDVWNNKYLSITSNEITTLLETYIKNKELLDNTIKILNK